METTFTTEDRQVDGKAMRYVVISQGGCSVRLSEADIGFAADLLKTPTSTTFCKETP